MLSRRLTVILCGFAALLAICTLNGGCGGGGAGDAAGDATPPSISNVRIIIPNDWTFEGGTITVVADVTDSGGVKEVHETITPPDSEPFASFGMTLSSGNTYYVLRDIPPNGLAGGQVAVYSVVVTATDNAGNSASSNPITFEVPAPDLPLPPVIPASLGSQRRSSD